MCGDVVCLASRPRFQLVGERLHVVRATERIGDTRANSPYERVEEWRRYLRTGRVPAGVDWIVLDRLRAGDRECGPSRFEDGRYTLCAGVP